MTNVLGIFAKQPRAGEVKTRLAQETTPDFAAEVAQAMLRDTLDRLAPIEVERWLVVAGDGASSLMGEYAAGRYHVASQGDGDLGARLHRFFQERLRAAQRVVVLGADSPTVPLDFVAQAFCELGRADVVLGPATDGGYYLVGCARRVPPIFTGIAWGGPTVLCDTMVRLEPSWRVALLPPWYDIDTLDDLKMLEGHLVALRHTGCDAGVPCVERLLAQSSHHAPRDEAHHAERDGY